MEAKYIILLKNLFPFFIIHVGFNLFLLIKKDIPYKKIIFFIPILIASFLFSKNYQTVILISSFGLFIEKKFLIKIKILNKVFTSILLYLIIIKKGIHLLFLIFLIDYIIEYLTIGLNRLITKEKK